MNNKSRDCPTLPWMVDFHSTEHGSVMNNQMKAAYALTHLEYMSALNIKSKPYKFLCTQLICTIPMQATCHTIEELMSLGMSVARIKMSVNCNKKAGELIMKIRTIVEKYSKKIGKIYPLAIAIEIAGPEIHTGQLKDPGKKDIYLKKGQITHITIDPNYEEFVQEDMIYVDYQKLPEIIQPGDKVILDSGSVALSALLVAESIVKCIVEKAGRLFSNASVTIVNSPLDLPIISANDKEIIKFGIEQNVDVIIMSGVVNRQSIKDVRDLLGTDGAHILLFSIVENSQHVEHADEIIKASDGVCIDGDRLMFELPKEKTFLAQKSVLAKCKIHGKPAICSINVVNVNSLSKAEVCDVANAVLDGTDGLLIPQEACVTSVVKAVALVCKEAEPAVHQKKSFEEIVSILTVPMEPIESICVAAVEASLKSNSAAIICLTCSGRTAKILSRFRPRCPIVAVTRYPRVARQLQLYRNTDPLIYVKPFQGDFPKDVDDRIQLGITYGKYMGYIRQGDAVVTLSASRPGSGIANSLKIVYASAFDALATKEKSK